MRSHSQKAVTNWAGPWSAPEAVEKPWRVRLLAVVNCAILVDNLVSEWASQRERVSAEGDPISPWDQAWYWRGACHRWSVEKLGLEHRRQTGSAGHHSVAHQLLHRDNCWGQSRRWSCTVVHVEPMSRPSGPMSTMTGPLSLSACRWSPVSGQMEPATQMAATIPIRPAIRRLLFLYSGTCACWDASGDGSTKRSSMFCWSIAECLGGWGWSRSQKRLLEGRSVEAMVKVSVPHSSIV
jgi:hypothetical protein